MSSSQAIPSLWRFGRRCLRIVWPIHIIPVTISNQHYQSSADPSTSVGQSFGRLCITWLRGFLIVLILDFPSICDSALVSGDSVLYRERQNDCRENVGSILRRKLKDPAAWWRRVSAMERGPLVRSEKLRMASKLNHAKNATIQLVIVASSASRSTLRAGFSHAFPVVLPESCSGSCWELWGFPKNNSIHMRPAPRSRLLNKIRSISWKSILPFNHEPAIFRVDGARTAYSSAVGAPWINGFWPQDAP